MKKLIITIAVFFTVLLNHTHAQEMVHPYMEEMKTFIKDWEKMQGFPVNRIIFNRAVQSDFDYFSLQFKDLHVQAGGLIMKFYNQKASGMVIDTMLLTKADVDNELDQLDKSKTFSWPVTMFHKAELQDFECAVNQDKDCKPYWEISMPAFIHDNTYCLLCYKYHCGKECGFAAIIIYKKENGQWKEFGTILNEDI